MLKNFLDHEVGDLVQTTETTVVEPVPVEHTHLSEEKGRPLSA